MPVVTLVNFGADWIAVADFNEDGVAEYVVGHAGSTELEVYGALDGGSPCSRIGLDSLPAGLSHGDFDGDGTPELAVALIDARISLYRADRALYFALARTITLPARPRSIAVSQVAGRLHLIIATATSIHAIDPMESDPGIPMLSTLVQGLVRTLRRSRNIRTTTPCSRKPRSPRENAKLSL